jgi:hypothetical protein
VKGLRLWRVVLEPISVAAPAYNVCVILTAETGPSELALIGDRFPQQSRGAEDPLRLQTRSTCSVTP